MKKTLTLITAALFMVGLTSQAMAYSCNALAKQADTLIKEADSKVTKDTDSRTLALIAQAKGMLQASRVSHGKASENHHGEKGKFMHGDAVRQARTAMDLAKEALFLLTDEPR